MLDAARIETGDLPADGGHAGTDTRKAGAPSRLRVGLLNNMPDAALASTERQFRRLIGPQVELRLFSLDSVARGPEAQAHLARAYASHRALPGAGLDALVVTGCEPRAANLADEPYYADFTQVVDWAARHTRSTLFSCLAAHAAVLHRDGIRRRPLPAKHSGIFACAQAAAHPLLAGAPQTVPVPHSRWNDLAEDDLVAGGYTVLRRSDEVGVDLFVREGESLLVFLQGHPEYDGDSLAREYRRDVGRYLAGERDDLARPPRHYFAPLDAERLAAFAERAQSARDPALFAQFPVIEAESPQRAAWQAAAAGLFRNWLGTVAARRLATAA